MWVPVSVLVSVLGLVPVSVLVSVCAAAGRRGNPNPTPNPDPTPSPSPHPNPNPNPHPEQDYFAPFYDAFMPGLKGLLQGAQGKDYRMLRGKATPRNSNPNPSP